MNKIMYRKCLLLSDVFLFQRDALILLVNREQSNGRIVPNGRVKVPAKKVYVGIITPIDPLPL